MNSKNFTEYDSIAIWNTINDSLDKNKVNEDALKNLPDELKEKIFKLTYVERNFNLSWINLMRKDRVIVGQNPGYKGTLIPKHSLLSFHWDKSSNDYKLASALYGTSFWGAFMTDLNGNFDSNSDSKKSNTISSDVGLFFKKIDKLGIDNYAKILVVGSNARDAFKRYNKENYDVKIKDQGSTIRIRNHKIIFIPHYSERNALGWRKGHVHEMILKN